jgi:light-regulated signal transduction histidine kinase (bacteriophytochrome)
LKDSYNLLRSVIDIDNALKFRSEATPEVYIAASLHSPDRWLIAVRDNCIGIKTQYTERIFEVFQRLNSRDKYPGTGMSLAICRKIVERHGGQITVDSVFGEGTKFTVTLLRKHCG